MLVFLCVSVLNGACITAYGHSNLGKNLETKKFSTDFLAQSVKNP